MLAEMLANTVTSLPFADANAGLDSSARPAILRRVAREFLGEIGHKGDEAENEQRDVRSVRGGEGEEESGWLPP